MTTFWQYFLAIGITNVIVALIQGNLILRPGQHYKHRVPKGEWVAGLLEAVFYLLFWWVQAAFWMAAWMAVWIGSLWRRVTS
ncbi:MAG: hypothetical protein HOV97_05665 [Nonomuraea sp.]|nr:hypothetical protein [Nonomuraea sp.]